MRAPASPDPQAASAVLMVRPAAFAANPETAATNAFQSRGPAPPSAQASALAEFDAVVAALEDTGVEAHVFGGCADGNCPDEIFPNNWVSFHADGTVVLYPLLAANRRRERRPEILDTLAREHGYRIRRSIDLTEHAASGQFLEGTGSLVLDRTNRIAYACRSPRTDARALADLAGRLDYDAMAFDAADDSGIPIYHTNVVMSVGTQFTVLCSEAIRDRETRANIITRLEQTGHSVVDINLSQLHDFAANILELRGHDGPVIALSTRALEAFDDRQRHELEIYGRLVTVPIPTIETYGGGSLRCMLAEIFLDRQR